MITDRIESGFRGNAEFTLLRQEHRDLLPFPIYSMT